MKKYWYFQRKGKTEGPISSEELKAKLDSGDLGPHDLVYREGASSWRSIIEIKELQIPLDKKTDGGSQWVVLQKGGEEFKKLGPFTTEEVRQKIKSGEIDISNHIWKEGMNEWYKVSSLSQFSSPRKNESLSEVESDEKTKEIYNQSSDKLLRKVQVQGEISSKSIDKIPDELSLKSVNLGQEEGGLASEKLEELQKSLDELASELKQQAGELGVNYQKSSADKPKKSQTVKSDPQDLDSTRVMTEEESMEMVDHLDIEENEKTVVRGSAPPPPNPVSEPKRKPASARRPNTARNRKMQKSSFGENILETFHLIFKVLGNEFNALFPRGSILRMLLFVGIFFSFVAYIAYSGYQNKQAEKVALQKIEEKKQKEKEMQAAKQKQMEIERAQYEAQMKALVKEPTFFKIRLVDIRKKEAKLELQSDAGPNHSYKVTIEGVSGTLVGKKGFYRELELPMERESVLYLDPLGMTNGYYHISVKVSKYVKKQSFFLGDQNNFYNARIKKYRKKIAVWHQKEKRAAYKTLKNLKDYGMQASSLIAVRKENKGRWKKLVANWKKRLKSQRSDYLNKVRVDRNSGLTHPRIWLDLRGLERELIALAESSTGSAKDYKSLIERLDRYTEKITMMSLW